MGLTPEERQAWAAIEHILTPDMPGPFKIWWRKNWPGVVVLVGLGLMAFAIWMGGNALGEAVRIR